MIIKIFDDIIKIKEIYMNRKEILREYLDMSIKADTTLKFLEEHEEQMTPGDIERKEAQLTQYNID